MIHRHCLEVQLEEELRGRFFVASLDFHKHKHVNFAGKNEFVLAAKLHL